MSTLALRGPLWVDARLHRLTLWTGAALLALARSRSPGRPMVRRRSWR
ncbi:hypothetical protein ACIA98_42920 [Streptomyces sp. NPDC051366]